MNNQFNSEQMTNQVLSSISNRGRLLTGEVQKSSGIIHWNSIHGRPYIEGQPLKSGDNDYEDLGLHRLTNSEIERIFTEE